MRMASGTFPAGSVARDVMRAVRDAWNDGPANFNFSLSWGDSSVRTGNFQNEVWATGSEYWLSGHSGVTVYWHVCGSMIEADVLLDLDHSWYVGEAMAGLMAYGGTNPSLHTVGIHEFGHVLGLHHESGTYNVMGDDSTHIHLNKGQATFYAGEDAANGAVDLYGSVSSNVTDLGVVHWRHVGSSGGYSIHDWTRVLRNSGGSSYGWFENPDGYRVYAVPAQTEVFLEVSFENNGNASRSPLVWYVVSSNDNITVSDTLLDTRTITVGRNTVYTTDRGLTLPATLTKGSTYFLGAIVDPHDTITEWDEGNNSTPVAIWVY